MNLNLLSVRKNVKLKKKARNKINCLVINIYERIFTLILIKLCLNLM